MVHRRLSALRLLLGALGLAAFLALGFTASPAAAANTRVSIADFQWSKEPTIDLGESVTWDWLGPDLQHSVTGQEPNATQWDSDPADPSPMQTLGRSYTVTFDQPGEYLFVCKLHPNAVRGTITVTDQPGNPNSDPGPQAPLNFDLIPPLVESVKLKFTNGRGKTVLGPRGKGTKLEFEVGERGNASIDYFRIVRKGKGRKKRKVRRYAGYHEAPVHVGINSVRFAHRSATFKAKPGRYLAKFQVFDENTNATPVFKLRFEIKGKKKHKKKHKKNRQKRNHRRR